MRELNTFHRGGPMLDSGFAAFELRGGDIMATARVRAQSIEEYIAAFPPAVRAILERIRSTISNAARARWRPSAT
jgi:hypothetical protein